MVDWRVTRLKEDTDEIQSPDKLVANRPYWFYRYWPDNGIDVDVLDIGKIPWMNYFESKVLRFFVIQSLTAYIKRKKYDLIISHSARSALVLAFLRSLMKERLPLHFVIDVGCFNGGRNNPAELYLIKKAIRSLSGIIAHSSIQSEYYSRYMPDIPHRFVHFGVDADYFKPQNLTRENYVLSFGSRARDYPTLIKAWEKIANEQTRLKIIGIDTMASVNCKDSNIDLVGRVSLGTLLQNIAKARFIVIPLPDLKYSYGQMSFLQSMALGKSCIVTKTPSSQDYLKHDKDALLVRPYDQMDLAEKITTLLENDDLNERIALSARETIVNKCNEKNMASEMYTFISELI